MLIYAGKVEHEAALHFPLVAVDPVGADCPVYFEPVIATDADEE